MEELQWNRRRFLQGMTALGASVFLPWPEAEARAFSKLTILHTNDWHSRIDPFPADGGKLAGLGGAARRSAYIQGIRSKEKHVLLLDSGDIWQGTPYFNFFDGELEYSLMNDMGYDVATFGNHDFDIGLDGLKRNLPKAKFQMVSSNYDFSETPIRDFSKPYLTLNKGEIKVGILGLGIELTGLVDSKNYGQTKYIDPIKKANEVAALLKNELKCNLVICLSHLGYKYENSLKPDDLKLAALTENIDIILGGHTHTFLKKVDQLKNKAGKPVFVNQAGWAGLMVGRFDLVFDSKMNLLLPPNFGDGAVMLN